MYLFTEYVVRESVDSAQNSQISSTFQEADCLLKLVKINKQVFAITLLSRNLNHTAQLSISARGGGNNNFVSRAGGGGKKRKRPQDSCKNLCSITRILQDLAGLFRFFPPQPYWQNYYFPLADMLSWAVWFKFLLNKVIANTCLFILTSISKQSAFWKVLEICELCALSTDSRKIYSVNKYMYTGSSSYSFDWGGGIIRWGGRVRNGKDPILQEINHVYTLRSDNLCISPKSKHNQPLEVKFDEFYTCWTYFVIEHL